MALPARVVLVYRRSEYSELLARHATYGQAEFFLRSRGRSIDEVFERHTRLEAVLHAVTSSLPDDVRRSSVERSDLDRYLFAPEDILMVVGQDGLVANVAKYLDGQPVIGVNPEPERNPGALVPHQPGSAAAVLADLRMSRATVEARTMVGATLDDGQSLDALNDLYIGDQGHQSSRYTITIPSVASERQSSSGIIVGTGTGSTGWSTSIAHDRALLEQLPDPTSANLIWFVREAWPSPFTASSLTAGVLGPAGSLELLVESDRLVVFGDGIERDYLTLSWGQRLVVAASGRVLNLVVSHESSIVLADDVRS